MSVRVYGCTHVAIEVDEVELLVWLLPYQEVQKVGIIFIPDQE